MVHLSAHANLHRNSFVARTCVLWHFSFKTEKTYVYWLGRYGAFLQDQPAKTWTTEQKIERFLTVLATSGGSASTQNQASTRSQFVVIALELAVMKPANDFCSGSDTSQGKSLNNPPPSPQLHNPTAANQILTIRFAQHRAGQSGKDRDQSTLHNSGAHAPRQSANPRPHRSPALYRN